jgi:hypothetical protein
MEGGKSDEVLKRWFVAEDQPGNESLVPYLLRDRQAAHKTRLNEPVRSRNGYT